MRFSIDIGFGDATVPGLVWLERRQLLDAPSARIRSYARETVVAAKDLHAVIEEVARFVLPRVARARASKVA